MTNSAEQDAVLLRNDLQGVATLTLNRPAQFNALSIALLLALRDALAAIANAAHGRIH